MKLKIIVNNRNKRGWKTIKMPYKLYRYFAALTICTCAHQNKLLFSKQNLLFKDKLKRLCSSFKGHLISFCSKNNKR